MACRVCHKCGRPKDCYDELCIMCELKDGIVEKVKTAVKILKGDANEKSAG